MINNDNFRILRDEEKSQYKFELCELCGFYECELIEEYVAFIKNNQNSAFPSYKNEMDCSMKRIHGYVECGTKSVADGIGDHFKIDIPEDYLKIKKGTDGKWEPDQSVIISAQTGGGKNHFVEKHLLPHVRELNHKNRTDQKVLIISNRIALRMQINDRLNGINEQDGEQGKIYRYGDYVDVTSYQSLLNRVDYLQNKQKNKSSRYIFIVCDEAHFFTSDAMFNPDTEKILLAIARTFKSAIRTYMTATPYECSEYISEYENRFSVSNKQRYRSSVFYHFKRDYNYLDIKYFSSHDELKNIIANSGKEKWLIFIDNKNKCRELKDDLARTDGMDGKVYAVDARSKHEEKYQKMVLSERLDDETNVLIATSVIDNGVNFRGINNIVISDVSKVKCLQMVGRGRVNRENPDGKITLYIKRFSAREVEKKLDHLKRQQDAYHEYDLAYNRASDYSGKEKICNYKEGFLNKYYNGSKEDWENAKHWFGRHEDDPARLYTNAIARSLVDKLVFEYNAIREEMQRTDSGQEVIGQNYLEYQLSWFGKKYDIENDITFADKDKDKKELIEFLESYVGKKMFKDKDDEQKKFCEEFTKLCDKAFGRQDKNKEREYSIAKINNILEKFNLNYQVKNSRMSTGNKETFWTVVKI